MPISNSVLAGCLRQRSAAAVTRWHNKALSRCHRRTALFGSRRAAAFVLLRCAESTAPPDCAGAARSHRQRGLTAPHARRRAHVSCRAGDDDHIARRNSSTASLNAAALPTRSPMSETARRSPGPLAIRWCSEIETADGASSLITHRRCRSSRDQRPGFSGRSGFSTRTRSGLSNFSPFSGLCDLSTLPAFSAFPLAETLSTAASVALTLLFTEPRLL